MRRRHCAYLLFALLVSTASTSAQGGITSAPGQLAPLSESLPSISGDTFVGQTLKAYSGKWNGPAATYSYQWVRCSSSGTACVPIAAATLQTYVVAASNVGSTLRLVVTASNKNGSAISTSEATPIIKAAVATATSTSATTTNPTTTTTTTTTTPTTTTNPTTTSTPTTTTNPTTSTTTATASTATTTTTTASPNLGTVLLRGNYETGTISPWASAQCENTGFPDDSNFNRGTFNIVSDLVAQGSRAARFDLPADTSRRTACEVMSPVRKVGLNTDDYYSQAVRFPTNWVEPGGWGMTISQPNYHWPGFGSPVLSLVANADRVRAVLQSGACLANAGGCQYVDSQRTAVPVGQMALGAWHQFIIHARWSVDSSGAIEIWHRLKGQTAWTKTVSISGTPTLQWPVGGTLDPTTNSYDKFGAYRGKSSVGLSIWQDATCRTTSFAAAESCFA
jgi:hypothetical protein